MPPKMKLKQEKLQVAKQLSKLGVDIIEAGFPIASPGDFDAVKRIAETVGRGANPPIICGLARALKKDIEVGAFVGLFCLFCVFWGFVWEFCGCLGGG